jgi:hypothetical protein
MEERSNSAENPEFSHRKPDNLLKAGSDLRAPAG